MNILFVDGWGLFRVRMTPMLKSINGVEDIVEAEDVVTALKELAERKFDVVICDISVPGSGLYLIETLKSNGSETVIIATAAFARSEYRILCARLGADYFFDKSDEYQKIPITIERIIHRRSKSA